MAIRDVKRYFPYPTLFRLRYRTVPRQADLNPLSQPIQREEEVELLTSSPDNHNSPPLTTGPVLLEAPTHVPATTTVPVTL